MKSAIAVGALLASAACAAPAALQPRQSEAEAAAAAAIALDIVVLKFALQLENLENTFYQGALTNPNLTEAAFLEAGYSASYVNDLRYIALDEQSHVEFLNTALNGSGFGPCTYNFQYTDVQSFITTSSVLEGVGTSAYLGAASKISNPDYLNAAGSILVTEALHTGLQRKAKGEIPFANAYGTPISPTSAFSLAAMFIVKGSCPPEAALPFEPFPALMYSSDEGCTCEEPDCTPSQLIKRTDGSCSPPTTGDSVTFTAAAPIPAGSFVTWVCGLNCTSIADGCSGNEVTVPIPEQCSGGQSYAFITNQSLEKFNETAVLFGPAIVEVAPAAPPIPMLGM